MLKLTRKTLLAIEAVVDIAYNARPDPVQARAMDLSDIRDLRRWHRDAALRARTAGADIVYVYAGHQLSTISHFLSPYRNRRSDQYGGSFENRARLLREILADPEASLRVDLASQGFVIGD